jgi:mRNA interferase RelE/StbE
MKYQVELKPTAVKDLKSLHPKDVSKVIARLEALTDDMKGHVKKLTNFTPEYRMRAGNYRALLKSKVTASLCTGLNIERMCIDDPSPTNS